MTREQLLATDELDAILHALPPELVQRVRGLDGLDSLLEIVMDLGRLPEARFTGREEILPERARPGAAFCSSVAPASGRRHFCARSRACSRTRWGSASSSSTPRTRSPATATSHTPGSAARAACRSPLRRCSTPS